MNELSQRRVPPVSRLLALIVLVGLLVAGLYYWRRSDAGARAAATDSLGNVGDRIGQVGQSVGNRLRDTKVTGQVKAALELNRTPPALFLRRRHRERGRRPARRGAHRGAPPGGGAGGGRRPRRQAGAERDPHRRKPRARGRRSRSVGESFDDRALEAKVNTAFSLNREMKGSDIKVSAFKREVTLTGTVTG